LTDAVREIGRIAHVIAVSPYHETDPVGFENQPPFLNAAVKILTDLSPAALLFAVKEIERRLGRTPTFRNGPRVIDIDLLDVRGRTVAGNRLTLPHPRMQERRFVLEPLFQIAPRWRHPRLGKTARQLLQELDD
jgi:2-amino-4-hydroxy-6-hydroxymethyldihydropteridine diphosphokinase